MCWLTVAKHNIILLNFIDLKFAIKNQLALGFEHNIALFNFTTLIPVNYIKFN